MSMRAQVWRAAAVVGLGLVGAAASRGQSLKNIEVLGTGAATRVVLDVDGGVTQRSFKLVRPDRVVIDLVGARNEVRTTVRSLETGPVQRLRVSQFRGAPAPVTRVVADLRGPVPFAVQGQDEDFVLVVGEDSGAGGASAGVVRPSDASAAAGAEDTSPGTVPVSAATSAVAGPVPAATPTRAGEPVQLEIGAAQETQPAADTASTTAVPSASATFVPVEPSSAAESEVSPAAAAAAESSIRGPETTAVTPQAEAPETGGSAWQAPVPVEDTSPQPPAPLTPSGGRRINLDVQGADIHTVLRTLADYSGKNIIASREVEGTVTARLYDTPWEDALASVLKAHGYGYVEEHGILRVGVVQKIRNEELEEAAAERKREDLLPIETQVVRMQFADADELKPALSDMLSNRGKLQVDLRTNALIVSDIPDYVAKVAAMARDLDSRTPQVEIVSKLVDVSADDSRNLGINWQAINLQPYGSNVIGAASVEVPTSGAAGKLRVGTVRSWGQLDAMLDALAKSKKANIVSNPNITTVNNREAKILVGAKIPLIVADQAGNAITQLTTIGIQMRVTPHINSDKTITMDLHPEVSELSSQATVQGGVIITTSEADTRVLVDNNETAIIGGLVRNVTSETRTGIPVLQDVPVLGALFRNTNKSNDKRELIIFVTPRIIEPGSGPVR